MSSRLANLIDTCRAVVNALTFRRDTSPIDSREAVERFVATRAAFVAQKSLYGYLKARIGTRYPRVFDDPVYVKSINIAKFGVYEACLSDLAVYAAAAALEDQPVTDEVRCALAMGCFSRGLEDNLSEAPPEFFPEAARKTFAERLAGTDWVEGALHRHNFSESPNALVRWAPIAEHLKKQDAESVGNSIKFVWRDIREQYRKRLVQEGVLADCRARAEEAI